MPSRKNAVPFKEKMPSRLTGLTYFTQYTRHTAAVESVGKYLVAQTQKCEKCIFKMLFFVLINSLFQHTNSAKTISVTLLGS